jgi:hypothetical protein
VATSFGSKSAQIVLALVIATPLLTAACGGGDDTVVPPPPSRTLNSISVSGGNTVQAGQTVQFTATGTFSSAPTTENITSTATWESSNNGVATVNNAGLATGVSAGSAEIRARLQNVTGTAPLAVSATPVLAARFTVSGPGGVDVCRQASNGDWDCNFDGSASTGGTGGAVVSWIWRFDAGPANGGPVTTTTPILNVNPTCTYWNNGRPPQLGSTGSVQVVVKLMVRNAAGELSAETTNNNVRLVPQNNCGFGF